MTKTIAFLLAGTTLLSTAPALAQHEHYGAPEPEQPDHGAMDHGSMDHGSMDHGDAQAEDYVCTAANVLPSIAGSGTSRLPYFDNYNPHMGQCGGSMHGLNLSSGDWMVMAHGAASLQYTDHSGPRGDDQAYVTSMLMLTGERETEWGRVQLKSMLSLEPLMDAKGYPNLFAAGETANGAALVDRQHPHDLFMELAARVDVNIAENTSLFLYGGPVGEPAIGPSAFMHRRSAANNPEPPIAHHWFDSTHITYGVATGGISAKNWQFEASAFRGVEPDEDRWDIETPKLDSWAVRATYNPTAFWAFQASYAEIEEPEILHPGQDEHRFTASAHYADGALSAMAAFSAKNRVPGDTLTAFLGEVNWDLDEANSLFGRAENVRNDELFPDHLHPLHDQAFRITKLQAGYARHFELGNMLTLTLGGSAATWLKPDALDPYYGNSPFGYTLFTRISLGH
jgi:hypothetical protein